MRDYDTLRLRALELARERWVSPRELAIAREGAWA